MNRTEKAPDALVLAEATSTTPRTASRKRTEIRV